MLQSPAKNAQSYADPAWQAARATTAAPVFFTEMEGFIDGGVLANNPSEAALVKINDFFEQRKEKLPISLVVSLGSGVCPEKELGTADVIYNPFAKPWERISNLLSILVTAVSRSTHNNKQVQMQPNFQYVQNLFYILSYR